MKSVSQFHTRQGANEGIELPLFNAEGEKTDYAIQIRGSHSDAFKRAQAMSRRTAVGFATIDNEDELFDKIEEERIKMLSSLVISWNLKDDNGKAYPCTRENIIELFTEAPQIANQVDKLSSKSSLFLKPLKSSKKGTKLSKSSTTGQKPASKQTKRRKGQVSGDKST